MAVSYLSVSDEGVSFAGVRLLDYVHLVTERPSGTRLIYCAAQHLSQGRSKWRYTINYKRGTCGSWKPSKSWWTPCRGQVIKQGHITIKTVFMTWNCLLFVWFLLYFCLWSVKSHVCTQPAVCYISLNWVLQSIAVICQHCCYWIKQDVPCKWIVIYIKCGISGWKAP